VPSQDGEHAYGVEYGQREYCSCPDHRYRDETCVHLYALGVAMAKGRIQHPEVAAGDPFVAAGRVRPCPVCMDAGVVYIGHMVGDPVTGAEGEVVDAVRCRRCNR
jgi:hypothetical protein